METEILSEPLFLGIFFFVALINSLIPAFVLKWVMSVKYLNRVSFLMILVVLVFTNLAMVFIIIWLGLLDEAAREAVPLIPSLLLFFASQLIQLMGLTLFVPDENGDLIPMHHWLVVIVLQWVVYFVIGAIFVLVVVALQLLASGGG